MPFKKFLEEFPLYRKYREGELPGHLAGFNAVPITMECAPCQSIQTYKILDDPFQSHRVQVSYAGGLRRPPSSRGKLFRMDYRCAHCEKNTRSFFVQVDKDLEWLMKVGQFPAWSVKGNPAIEKMLGEHSEYFQRGLICESQGFGIGAFAYYRRIVEEVIDDLLDEITELTEGAEEVNYRAALAKTKNTRVAQDKIALVKDLLPSILRPQGVNPLGALHSALSGGLHVESDEDCLAFASDCRAVLVFLVDRVAASKDSSKTFTDSMRRLLDRKA